MNQLKLAYLGSDTLPTMPQVKKSSVVGAFDAKNKLGQLLDKVSQGEVIVITRHGVPVAKLVPYADGLDRADALAAIEEIRVGRRGCRLPPGVTIKSLIEAGRR